MRKTTRTIMSAFLQGRPCAQKNTHTDGRSVWLHGNEIIRRRGDGFEVSLAGWNTLTTRERINGFLRMINSPCCVSQKDFKPMFHGPDGCIQVSAGDWLPVTCSSSLHIAA